jgi:hypothetical protein
MSTIPPATGSTILFNRSRVRAYLPWYKAVISLIGWSNSAITTVLCVVWAVEFVTKADAPMVAYVGGFVLAFLLTLGQIMLGGWGYVACLAPDIGMTAAQHQRWMSVIARYFLGAMYGSIVGWVCATALGYWSARLPEHWTFGRRA